MRKTSHIDLKRKVVHLLLSKLYCLRVMSYKQVQRYVFEENGYADSYCKQIIKLLRDEYIKQHGRKEAETYFTITSKGVNFLKINGIMLIGNNNDITMLDEVLAPFKITVHENMVNHQLGLNEFVLDFERRYKEFEYYDEKYISQVFSKIRPDGLIKYNNTFYFLEMDMSMESTRALNTKWERYRQFLNTDEFQDITEKCKVLFILGGKYTAKSNRKYQIRHNIEINLIDLICEEFDIYVDTHENLIDVVVPNEELVKIMNKNEYNVSGLNYKNQQLNNYSFTRYTVKKVKESDGVMDFVIDDFTKGNMYVIKKMLNYYSIKEVFNQKRGLHYIVIVQSEYDALKLIKQVNGSYPQIYFTTYERLRENPLHNALFQIDQLGHIIVFKDKKLEIQAVGKKITRNL